MFQFPGFAPGVRLVAGGDAGRVAPFGNPRFVSGICPSARLIAACHVLLRLREPRHPSCALLSFPYAFFPPPAFRPGRSPRQVSESCILQVTLALCLRNHLPGDRLSWRCSVRLSTLSLSSSYHHVSVLVSAPPPTGGPACCLLRRSPWLSCTADLYIISVAL